MAAPLCLILRPGAAAEATASLVKGRGWQPLILPSRTLKWLDAAITPRDWQAITATSAHGLQALARLAGQAFPALFDRPVLTVGDATMAAARQLGWVKASSAGGDVATLCSLACRSLQPHAGPILYPRSRVVAGDLEGCLAEAGFDVAAPVVYETRPADGFAPALRAVLSSGSGSILVHAPSAGRDLAEAADGMDTTHWTVVCMSRSIASTLAGLQWAAITVATRPDEAALLDALSVHQPQPPACRP